MIRLTRSQLQPIGLDIGHDSIKMLQLEVTGNFLSVRAAGRSGFSDEAKAQPRVRLAMAGEMVRQMLREGAFSGRQVVAALPRELVHMKNFRLPPMPAVEMEGAVQLEARNLFSFDVDQASVQFLPAGEVRQGNEAFQEVIVLAARNEDIAGFVEQLHRWGLAVDSLDIAACALFRGVERFIRRREDEQDVHVLVDVGYGASLVAIGKGREISFLKTIDIGGMHLHQAISRKLGISPAEAQALRRRLVEGHDAGESPEKRDPVRQAVFDATRGVMEQLGKELSLCLRYQAVIFRGCRPTRVRLLGGEAADTQLQDLLNSIVTIPVEAGRPLYSVDVSRMKLPERRGIMAEWALALGLGLKRTTTRFAQRDGRPRDAAGAVVPETAETAPQTEEAQLVAAGVDEPTREQPPAAV
jgi:type IV pilus assembly protein PilM